MNFCVHCGNRLPEGAQFCGNCGSSTGHAAPTAPTTPAASVPGPPTLAAASPTADAPAAPAGPTSPWPDSPSIVDTSGDRPGYGPPPTSGLPTYPAAIYGPPTNPGLGSQSGYGPVPMFTPDPTVGTVPWPAPGPTPSPMSGTTKIIIGAVAAFVALVLLAAAGLVAWLRFGPSTNVASCVVGVWQEDSNKTTISPLTDGDATTITITGGRQEYRSDHSLVSDYTGNVRQISKTGSDTTEDHLHGTIHYHYEIANGRATYSNGRADGTYTTVGESGQPKDMSDFVSSDPTFVFTEELTCSRDHLTQHGERTDTDYRVSWTVTLTRVS